ncbi:hypothetical protein GCM10007933_17270 [Zoogloea oryzae]|uniref:Secreted protein n=1 Tax=Zoogloea oryzae TaxID=310767 RepID=A0ABQ6F9L8_9RHOO|nr:hypothetical protein [Zoogloea oryzae]GLT22268.1 hypothetical protein GCM10007933_17270 [Zoogloea oryzae]
MIPRRLAALVLVGASFGAIAADSGPLPGEIVTRIGQVAAIPADQRKVPGFAGAWRPAAAQDKVVERIAALAARATPACRDIHVTATRQASPDLIETRPVRVHHALERWTADLCGTPRDYDVWYRYEPNASRLVVTESATDDFQAELDPPLRRLRELAAQRRTEESAGGVRWLNLPLPPDTVPATTQAAPAGKPGPWSADFVPLGESIREWTQLVSVQGLPRIAGSGQARALLEGMQAARARACDVPAGPVVPVQAGDKAEGETLKTVLVCPQVPGTNFAEMAVIKAIEGPDQIYLIQRTWRLPAGDADKVRADSREAQATADAFIDKVRLCNPATDTRACPAPFPR